MVVNEQDVDHFNRTGWLLTSPFFAQRVADVRSWIDDVQSWPDDGDWLNYRELTERGTRICRTENFVPFHPQLRQLLTSGPIIEIAGALLGEAALLYKEKINYKLAGGAGYSPHQDAPAYRFVETHISCMIAIDDSLIANGCLEVVSGRHQRLLAMNERGCITEDQVRSMVWQPVELKAGDVLWFHSLTPHRSGPNLSDCDRRAMYPTFNAASEGNLREAYYEQKLREFRENTHSAETVQVSLIDDFEGRPV